MKKLISLTLGLAIACGAMVMLDVPNSEASSATYNPGYPNPAGASYTNPAPVYPFANPIPTTIAKPAFTQLPTAPVVGGAGPASSATAVTTSYSRQRGMNTSAWSKSNTIRR